MIYFSSAFAISPNGRYAGGYVVDGTGPDSGLPMGFIKDLQTQELTFLADPLGGALLAPVIDVSDDGRIAVGDPNVLLHYTQYESDVGFIAIDGIAQNFTKWLADRYALDGLSFEVVRAVYRQGDRYHFVAQTGNNTSWAGTAYYISIPVNSIFALTIDGDFSGDGVVDAADYVVWRDQLNANYTPADYEVWRANFGRVTGTGADAISTATPEPASILLAVIALLALFRPRMHRLV